METITQDGEIVETTAIALTDNSTAVSLARAEIDVQIATARQFPRRIRQVADNINTLATLDEETAAECLYALVRKKKGNKRPQSQADDRDNKPIEGPSIRLAEIAAQCFGNCRVAARVTVVDRVEKFVEAEGVFHDLETNMAHLARVRRRISTSTGGLFSDDMIVVTGNAACSIAKRNAILAGIPRGLYREAYKRAREIVAGTVETLSVNREKAIKAFAVYGVTPEQIFEALGIDGEHEITVDHIATLRGMFATLKSEEATVEAMFPRAKPMGVQNPLSDETPSPSETAHPAHGAPQPPTTPPEIEAAFQRGREAFLGGIAQRSVPGEFRTPERKAELDAWLDGWQVARTNAVDQKKEIT